MVIVVKINGQKTPADGTVLADYLAQNGYDCKKIAVEINEEIVPKRLYGETVLKDGDIVEIVNFVGGG